MRQTFRSKRSNSTKLEKDSEIYNISALERSCRKVCEDGFFELEQLIRGLDDIVFEKLDELKASSERNGHFIHLMSSLSNLCDYFSDLPSKLIALNNLKQLNFDKLDYNESFLYFTTHQDELNYVMQHLADDESRDALKYPLILWLITPIHFDAYPNYIYSEELHGSDFRLFNHFFKSTYSGNEHIANLEKQYLPEGLIKIDRGDVIIDGGAYDGDTAEIFSKCLGESGHIYSFEPAKKLYQQLVLKKLGNMTPENFGLSNFTGEVNFHFDNENDKGSSVFLNGSEKIDVTTIDEYVALNSIESVDYIKMDIEGSELNALIGAEQTIRKVRPTMAICIYHNFGRDFIEVPYYLISKYSEFYDFYVRQHSASWSETVLYCVSKRK